MTYVGIFICHIKSGDYPAEFARFTEKPYVVFTRAYMTGMPPVLIDHFKTYTQARKRYVKVAKERGISCPTKSA